MTSVSWSDSVRIELYLFEKRCEVIQGLTSFSVGPELLTETFEGWELIHPKRKTGNCIDLGDISNDLKTTMRAYKVAQKIFCLTATA